MISGAVPNQIFLYYVVEIGIVVLSPAFISLILYAMFIGHNVVAYLFILLTLSAIIILSVLIPLYIRIQNEQMGSLLKRME